MIYFVPCQSSESQVINTHLCTYIYCPMQVPLVALFIAQRSAATWQNFSCTKSLSFCNTVDQRRTQYSKLRNLFGDLEIFLFILLEVLPVMSQVLSPVYAHKSEASADQLGISVHFLPITNFFPFIAEKFCYHSVAAAF